MQAYAYNFTMQKKGTLTLRNLPFSAGEQIEVIIIPRPKNTQQKKERYPFQGKPITYLNPTDPLPETDWEVYK